MFRFIIVDNDSHIRDEVASIIDWKNFGFRLMGSYGDVNSAIKAIGSQRVDLIMANLNTKEMDGLSFASIIKHKYPSSKVIIYSTVVDVKSLLEAYKIKIDDFLVFPIENKILIKSISNIQKELLKQRDSKRTLNLLKTELSLMEQIIEKRELDSNCYDFLSYEYYKRNLNKYHLLMAGKVFCVAVIKGAQDDELLTNVSSPVYFPVFMMIDNFLQQKENCLVVQSIYGYAVVIMSDVSEEQLNMKFANYLKTLKSKVRIELDQEIFIGIGRNVYTLHDICGSWRDAISAVDYKYVQGWEHIISYSDILRRTNKDVNYSIVSIERKIINAINDNNFSNAVYNIKLFFQNMRTHLNTIEAYFYYVHHLIISIRKTLSKNYSLPSNEIDDRFSVLSRCNFNYIDNDEQLLITTLKQVMHSPLSKKEYSSESVYKKAISYIENNYYNPELSLNMVCKHLALSVSYFSSIFKNYSGTTFVDYLTTVRIEKAKELLVTTNKKSYEIAEKIGYNDPHYFSILFKKKTGYSPTKYKQNTVLCLD